MDRPSLTGNDGEAKGETESSISSKLQELKRRMREIISLSIFIHSFSNISLFYRIQLYLLKRDIVPRSSKGLSSKTLLSFIGSLNCEKSFFHKIFQ